MFTIITSDFGNINIDNESYVTYYTHEEYCDKDGNPTSKDNPKAYHVGDLVIETASMRVRFPRLYLGKDYHFAIREENKAFYYNKQDKMLIELEKLLDFAGEMKMIGSDSIIVETK